MLHFHDERVINILSIGAMYYDEVKFIWTPINVESYSILFSGFKGIHSDDLEKLYYQLDKCEINDLDASNVPIPDVFVKIEKRLSKLSYGDKKNKNIIMLYNHLYQHINTIVSKYVENINEITKLRKSYEGNKKSLEILEHNINKQQLHRYLIWQTLKFKNPKTTTGGSLVKWTRELNSVKKYINSDYIYFIWEQYKFPKKHNGEYVNLHSNINVYEGCFISGLVHHYLMNFKAKTEKTLNIMEVGLAYGTSTLIIMNKVYKFAGKVQYDIIDANQSTQWENIGVNNIEHFMAHIHATNIKYQIHEVYSTEIIPKLTKKYDIIFIDGGHSTEVVINDLNNSHKLLKVNGIMILDDVLHGGVRDALQIFEKTHIIECYRIIYLKGGKYVESKKLYRKRDKISFDDPSSMFCLQRIK